MGTAKNIVLKFGGSVLHNEKDFDSIQNEINLFLALDYHVVAVVSAFYGVTERLIQYAIDSNIHSDSIEYAELIASGEFESAAALVKHLKENGVNAARATPAELGFLACGDRTAATPQNINASFLLKASQDTSVIIVPGFSAIDENGDCVLLGRGGSDISAVCLVEALGLNSVRLLKDVDGLYNRDPNKFDDAKRLDHVDYDTARKIGGELIQEEAITFASNKGIYIDIAAIGSPNVTRIGAAPPNHELSAINSDILHCS